MTRQLLRERRLNTQHVLRRNPLPLTNRPLGAAHYIRNRLLRDAGVTEQYRRFNNVHAPIMSRAVIPCQQPG